MSYTIKELSQKIIHIECGSNFTPFEIRNTVISGNVFGDDCYTLLNSNEILAYLSNPMLNPHNLEKKLPIRCRHIVSGEEFTLEIPYTNTGLTISDKKSLDHLNPFKG